MRPDTRSSIKSPDQRRRPEFLISREPENLAAAEADAPPPPAGSAPRRGDLIPRVVGLDGVRGLAIAMVLSVHAFTTGFTRWWWLDAVERTAEYGWLGVDLFFVLSGYLVTRMLHELRDHPAPLREFFRRRALRILPAYFFVLGAAWFVYQPIASAFGLAGPLPEGWWFVFALQNYFYMPGDAGTWPGLKHLWSIAVEIQFYLMWPLLVFAKPARTVLAACATMIVAAIAAKLVLLAATPDYRLFSYMSPLTRFDAFAAGGLVAALSVNAGELRRPPIALLAALAGAVWFAFYAIEAWQLGQHVRVAAITPVAAIASAGLILWITDARSAGTSLRRLFESQPLVLLGKYSYGIYLLHVVFGADLQTVLMAVAGRNGIDPKAGLMMAGVLIWPIAILLAFVMYRYVETPFLRRR